jgi:hypothetical protein
MATIVEKKFVDDLDGSEAAETIPFSFDGMDLEIDLSGENALRFRMAFAEFVAAARPRVKAKPQGGKRKRENPETTQIRNWWRQEGGGNGVRPFVAKGRIPADVMAQFRAAGGASASLALVA